MNGVHIYIHFAATLVEIFHAILCVYYQVQIHKLLSNIVNTEARHQRKHFPHLMSDMSQHNKMYFQWMLPGFVECNEIIAVKREAILKKCNRGNEEKEKKYVMTVKR